MAITLNPPGTIYLGGPKIEVGDTAAGAAITPGHLCQRYIPSGTINRVRKHANASQLSVRLVAMENSAANKSVSDDYNANDLVQMVVGGPGVSLWMWIPSGANISYGALLESNGDGTLKAGTTAPLFGALETLNNSVGLATAARIRVEGV